MMAFHTLTTLIQKGASQGISEGTAIIVAAVGGALLAAVLQTLGAFLINFLAARREERAAARESEKRHEQWEREDQLRREEQKEAAQQRRQAHRVEAYRKVAAATAFAIPLDEDRRAEQLAKLTETHTEVQAYGSHRAYATTQVLFTSVPTEPCTRIPTATSAQFGLA